MLPTQTTLPRLPSDHPLAGYGQPIADLQDVGRYFHHRGWSVGTSSNYSVVVNRDPLQLVITASGMDKGRLSTADFVLVGQDGQATTCDQPKSSAETMLHVILARSLPDVGAVLHTHSIWGTLLSDRFESAGQVLIEGYEMLKGLEGIKTHDTSVGIRVVPNTQDIARLAADLEPQLAAGEPALHYGFLLARHGLYTWGTDVAQARRHVEILEFLFEVLWRQASK